MENGGNFMKNLDLSSTYGLNLKDLPDVLIPSEVSRVLRVGRCSTYKLLSKGKIRAFKIGNQYKIPKQAVLEYIQNEQQ